MKYLTSIVIGAGLLAATSIACAAGQLAPVSVHQNAVSLSACTPPNASRECADFHAAIRNSFTSREIGMLFGGATAYQEYVTSNDRVRAKYAAFVRNVEENGVATAVAIR